MVNKCILWRKENATVLTVGISRVWNMTKFISAFYVCLVLFIGCTQSDLTDPESNLENLPNLDDLTVREQILAEAVDRTNLQTRQSPAGESLHYLPNQQVPYTGWVKRETELWQVKDGKRHGLYLNWYSNQQNQERGFYKDGSRTGSWTFWHENGQKSKEGAYKDGSKDGYGDGLWTFWTKDGQKSNGLIHPHVNSVAFSPDGRTLASGDWENTVVLWEVVTGRFIQTLEGHSSTVFSITFSPDGRTLASGSTDDTIVLWDVAAGKRTRTLEGHSSGVVSIAFSPDGRTLASASGDVDGVIRLWDIP